MEKILVTGGSGFIGRHCIKELRDRNYEVHAISRSLISENHIEGVIWYQLDLFDLDKVEKIFKEVKPKFLMHLAWKMETGLKLDSDENESWYYLSKEIVDFFYAYGGERAVVSGSCFEYDHNSGDISEASTPLKPNNEYGRNKNRLFRYLESLNRTNGISYAWARVFFTFGPGQKLGSLVPYVITSLLKDEVVETTDGNQEYDYLYIKDVVHGLILTLESNHVGPVNICSSKATKLKSLISTIAKKFNKEELIKFGVKARPKGSPSRVVGINDVLKNSTEWSEKYVLEDAIQETINYYKA